MMQTFRISDALRCVILNTPKGPNLARPGNGLSRYHTLQNLSLWKRVLTQRDNRITLTWWNGIREGALLSARTRAGHRVWEIDHFYLLPDSRDTQANGSRLHDYQETATLEVLERLIQLVGQRGGERIFLRLPSGNPAICLARQSGFFPSFEETLLEGPGGQPLEEGEDPVTSFRVRQPQDDFPLFQLFSAATPATVREAVGLTFDQWQDAQEPCANGRQEWLKESDGKIVGWLGLFPGPAATEGKVMARPEHPEVLADMVKLALCASGGQKWLVPDYQEAVGDQLCYRGFQEIARYTVLIKMVAAPALRHGMAPVEA